MNRKYSTLVSLLVFISAMSVARGEEFLLKSATTGVVHGPFQMRSGASVVINSEPFFLRKNDENSYSFVSYKSRQTAGTCRLEADESATIGEDTFYILWIKGDSETMDGTVPKSSGSDTIRIRPDIRFNTDGEIYVGFRYTSNNFKEFLWGISRPFHLYNRKRDANGTPTAEKDLMPFYLHPFRQGGILSPINPEAWEGNPALTAGALVADISIAIALSSIGKSDGHESGDTQDQSGGGTQNIIVNVSQSVPAYPEPKPGPDIGGSGRIGIFAEE